VNEANDQAQWSSKPARVPGFVFLNSIQNDRLGMTDLHPDTPRNNSRPMKRYPGPGRIHEPLPTRNPRPCCNENPIAWIPVCELLLGTDTHRETIQIQGTNFGPGPANASPVFKSHHVLEISSWNHAAHVTATNRVQTTSKV
jgi:hypothetical protein